MRNVSTTDGANDAVIGVLDLARARLIAHATAPETKTLWGFHPFQGLPSGLVPRVVRDASYWHLPVGTRIVPHVDKRTPKKRARDLDIGKRILQSGDDDLIRRWLHGEDVEHLVK
jgi:hypothetical protein